MSKFTKLLLGIGTTGTAAIIALANFLPGSQILEGNLFFDTVNNATPKVYVNTSEVLNLATSGLGFVTNGSQSGVVLKDNGTVAFATRIVTCTGTGGNVKVSGGAKYDTCIVSNPLSTTGAIQRIDLMVSASPAAVGIDCGFVKGLVSGTGTSFTNLGNVATATGLTLTFSTGSLQWNPVDYIKCGTLGTPTTSFAAKLRIQYFDTTAE